MSLEWCSTCETPVEISTEVDTSKAIPSVFVVEDGRAHLLLTGRKKKVALKKHAPKAPEKVILQTKKAPVVEAPVAPVEEVVENLPPVETSLDILASPRVTIEPTRPQPPQPPEEPWEPQPEDWFFAEITTSRTGYAVAALSNGERVFIPFGDIRRITGCAYIQRPTIGQKAVLRMRRNEQGFCPYEALEIRIDESGETPQGE